MPQRSPIIVALLFAATLAIDVVVAYWMATRDSGLLLGMLFYALTFAQLNVLAVWAVFGRPKMGRRWVVPVAGAVAFAAAWAVAIRLGPNSPPTHVSDFTLLSTLCGVFWMHIAAAMIVLWMLKSTRLIAADYSAAGYLPWRFSVGQLFTLTTGGCVLLTLFVANEMLKTGSRFIVDLVAPSMPLLATLVFACRRPWYWPWRLATIAAAAIAIGLFSNAFVRGLPGQFDFIAFALIQSFVTWAWLELAPILPVASGMNATAEDEPPAKAVRLLPEA